MLAPVRRALRVLLVEDSDDDAQLLTGELRHGGYDPDLLRVDTAEAMSAALTRQSWDVVISDYSLPRFNGRAALELLRRTGLDLPFIIVTGTIGEDVAVNVMKAGAHDYIIKGNLRRLTASIERELREAAHRHEHREAQERLRLSEERFRQMAENISEVFWMTNLNKTEMLYVSPGFETIWGRPCDALYERPRLWVEAVHPEDRTRIESYIVNRQVTGHYDDEYRIVRPDGSVRWIRDRASPIRDSGGRVYRIAGIAEDITERKEAGHTLKHSEERLRMAIDAGRLYTFEWNIDSGLLTRSGRHAEVHEGNGAISSISTFFRSIHADDLPGVQNDLELTIRDKTPFNKEFRLVRPDGEIRWINSHAQPLTDATGRTVRLLGVTKDVTERKKAEHVIEHAAFYDSLTGLPNRNKLNDSLLAAIHSGNGDNTLALLLLDLNNFKEINDTLGHDRGDLVLTEVAIRLQCAVATPNLVARLGGDEFAILMRGPISTEGLDAVTQEIQNALHPPITIDGMPIVVEAGIGVALYPQNGKDPDSLLRRADIAMYAAKKAGAGYVIYDAKHDQHSPARLSLMAELRHAIEQDQLVLYYQPKIDLRNGDICGAEALVRWKHPQHGLMAPDTFIGAAERTGVIHPLTEWVMLTAVRQCRQWQKNGLKIPLAINLSARSLFNPTLPEQIQKVLREQEVSADSLVVEITETAIMADPLRAREILQRIHDIGIQIAIDDFGIGYSSLAYLRRLPVDRLKVDKSFVTNMARDADDAMIVHSTIDLAHALRLEVVAEGVENRETYDQLMKWGCDTAQGYLISRPLPAEAFESWLRESTWTDQIDKWTKSA